MTLAATRRMIGFSRLCATSAGVFALLTLVGYALAIPSLIALHTGLQAMSPLTAAGLLLLMISALAVSLRRADLAVAAALLAGTAGMAALSSHLLHGADMISPWLVTHLNGAPSVPVGRTSIATAAASILIAIALSLRRRLPFAADASAGMALLIAGIAILGYLYGVGDLYALPIFNSMALHTAIALSLLALSALTVEPRLGWARVIGSDDVGGAPTRRQLAFVLVPVLVGWLLTRGLDLRTFGPGIAMALLVIVTTVPWTLLVLRDGHVLQALDRARRDQARSRDEAARELNKQLVHQARELAQESAERAKAEEAVNRTQRLEMVGQLTGGIAHDFNNLLMAISGNVELLRAKLPPGDPRMQRYADNAAAATAKGAKITAQLLAFSRSQRLDIRPAELDPVLASAKELIGTSLGPNAAITLDLQAHGCWATIDAGQLELAIVNLAVNARDAMPGGGHITIESRNGTDLLDGDTKPTDCLTVRVIDDGTGMAPAVLSRATEPFFTTKPLGHGTGLGLAQVYGFVRQCRGELRIASVEGAGTAIEMLFRRAEPLAERVAPVDDARREISAVNAAVGQTIVVIDDDDSVRAVIVDALTNAGFDVLEAKDGESGLAMLNAHRPAAAVIDFLMPGMNGAEVARRAQAARPDLPIIFVSGYSDTVALDGIAGAVVLRKPFDMQRLSSALTSLLH